MKTKMGLPLALLSLSLLSTGCTVEWKVLEAKSKQINNFERVSIALAKENRELIAEVNRMKFEMEKVRQENIYYKAQSGVKGEATHGEATHAPVANANHGDAHATDHATSQNETPSRKIASVGAMPMKKDYVEYDIYKWKAEDMHKIAENEFKNKNFEKAAQFYYSILQHFPKYQKLNDDFYFKAGVSAFETGEHHEWALVNFEYLMAEYPTSQYYRSAKLWSSLTHLKMGDKKKFFTTVEEFRKKYRNSPEWKILSAYYEKIEEKTNE